MPERTARLDALCRTQSPGSGLEAARTSFEAAHRPLHEVAAELADVDRELAEVTRQGLVALGRATSECSGTA